MNNLANKIQAYLGRTPDFQKEVILQNDTGTDYIKEWNITSEKAKPTDEQLNALSSQATALENTAKIDAKRQTEYLSWQQQFEMIYKVVAWEDNAFNCASVGFAFSEDIFHSFM